ncbi:MAG: hypothetical protein ACKN9W_05465 [Methylococcus sp.]
MILTDQPSWQQSRSQFNHQWFKNEYFLALDIADHIIDGRIRGDNYLVEMMSIDVPKWREHRQELVVLLKDFEREMSPRRIFDDAPLSHCDTMTNEIFSELIHELWLARYPIKKWLNNARIASEEVDAIYEKLLKLTPADSNNNVNEEFASCFRAFRAACQVLSEAIENFPHKILVT